MQEPEIRIEVTLCHGRQDSRILLESQCVDGGGLIVKKMASVLRSMRSDCALAGDHDGLRMVDLALRDLKEGV